MPASTRTSGPCGRGSVPGTAGGAGWGPGPGHGRHRALATHRACNPGLTLRADVPKTALLCEVDVCSRGAEDGIEDFLPSPVLAPSLFLIFLFCFCEAGSLCRPRWPRTQLEDRSQVGQTDASKVLLQVAVTSAPGPHGLGPSHLS